MTKITIPPWAKMISVAVVAYYLFSSVRTSDGKIDWNFVFTFGVPVAVAGMWAWSLYKKNREWRQGIENFSDSVKDSLDNDQYVSSEPGPAVDYDPSPDDNSDGVASGTTEKLSKAEVARAARTGMTGESLTVIPLDVVVKHLNDRRDEVPHFMVIGGTGAGKSTFCRMILGHRVARGEQFVILAGKRTAVFADVPSIGRDAISVDGTLKFDKVRAISRALLGEVVRRDNTDFDSRSFKTLNIVIDDASILMSEIDEVVQMARVVGLLGREIDMRLIILTGSMLVKELGFEGRGDLRDHFGIVTYRKTLEGTRITLFRPRYDEKENSPFDAGRVPELASRVKIDPAMAWSGPRLRSGLKLSGSTWLSEDDVVFTDGVDGLIGAGTPSNNSNNGSNNNGIDKLSRYNDVLRRLKKGESQHIIAGAVGVSLATVNNIAQVLNYVEEEKV